MQRRTNRSAAGQHLDGTDDAFLDCPPASLLPFSRVAHHLHPSSPWARAERPPQRPPQRAYLVRAVAASPCAQPPRPLGGHDRHPLRAAAAYRQESSRRRHDRPQTWWPRPVDDRKRRHLPAGDGAVATTPRPPVHRSAGTANRGRHDSPRVHNREQVKPSLRIAGSSTRPCRIAQG